VWSPDGKKIAYADQSHTLYVMPAEGGAPKKVDRSDQAAIVDYVWSPDGRYIAYSRAARTDYFSLCIYDTKDAKVHTLTTGTTNDFGPAWDPEGRYLYFLSTRATNPVLAFNDVNVIDTKSTVPLLMLLRKDVPNPFAANNGLPDEAKKAEAKDDKAKTSDKKSKSDKADDAEADKAPKPIEIDFDGLGARYAQFPKVARGQYTNIAATAKFVYFLSNPITGMKEQPGLFEQGAPQATLQSYELEKKSMKSFAEGVTSFVVALKSDKIAVMKKPGEISVYDAGATAGDAPDAGVSLAGVVVELDPREEWAQIFHEAWRQQRDFYYDPNMGGLDWKAIGDHYATLLPRLADRSDLTDLLGEMIAELSTSHTYVIGGDPGKEVTRISTGVLGADVKREGAAFKLVRIYHGDPADNVRSPLNEPGVNVAEGDYVLAVNHRPFTANQPFVSAFEDLAGKDVVLTVNSKPVKDGARDVV
jgi:tricorn protease